MIFTMENFDQEVLQSEQPVLVDFYADWCGPCKMMGPVIEQLSEELAGKMKVGKCNVDDNMQLAQKYGISSIPAFLVFRGGQVATMLVGAMSASEMKQKLSQIIDA